MGDPDQANEAAPAGGAACGHAARSVGVDPARRRLRCSELRLQPTLWGGAGAGGAPAAPPGLPPRGGAPSTAEHRPTVASGRRKQTPLGDPAGAATDEDLEMKAMAYDAYGSFEALVLRDVDTPVVRDHEVLVRVRAAGLHVGDCFSVRGAPLAVQAGDRAAQAEVRCPGLRPGRSGRGGWHRRDAIPTGR